MSLRRIRATSFLRFFSCSGATKIGYIGLGTVTILLLVYIFTAQTPVTEISQRYSSPTFEDVMEYVKVKSVDETPVSPLELIPDYEVSIQKKLDASWDFLFRHFRYKQFFDLDLNTKCKFYFQNLYNMNHEWDNDFHKFAFDISEESHADILKGAEKDNDGVALFNEESLKQFKRIHDIALAMERYRLYDVCFIQEGSSGVPVDQLFLASSNEEVELLDEQLDSDYQGFVGVETDLGSKPKTNQWEFEHRMNPIISYFEPSNFTKVMPVFVRADGQVLEEGNFPDYHGLVNEKTGSRPYAYDARLSFWGNWNEISSLSGNKGIVISAGDGQVDFTIKLLATLRYQKNHLPIQIVHFDQLSEESIKRLTYAAQSPDFSDGPEQDIWYVNVKPTIDDSVRSNFDRFKNKWLSVLFNTFEEFIFLDADAISYLKLDDYFSFPEYLDTGALFFKDRALKIGNGNRCPALFETLEPKVLETLYFNTESMISPEYVESQCMNNLTPEEKVYKDFFENLHQHQLESGLLVINKRKHIMGLLVSTVLNISPKVGGCSWGDKEFFWLGLLVAGHRYSIYDVDAGAVGKVQQTQFIKNGDSHDRFEINSAQVAHTSYDHKLLWINGGSMYCKKKDRFEGDWEQIETLRKDFKDDKERANFAYTDVIDIDSAIVPDQKSGDWGKRDERCSGYFWAARYSVKPKPYSYNKKIVKGDLFRFSKDELEHIKKLNKVWNEAVVELK